jgi:hypothetical protein
MRKQRSAAKGARDRTGGLVESISRRLPKELLQDRLFRRLLKDSMRGYTGIYVLYSGETPCHTGATGNLLRRLRPHVQDEHERDWDHFVIVRAHRHRHLKDVERLLHALIETGGTIVRGEVPKNANISRLFRQEVWTHKRQARAYEKTPR